MTEQSVTYDDFVFWDRSRGNILATESLQTNLARDHAQRLARKHQTTVSYGVVCEYFVEPGKCPNCKEIMPETGPCWCSSFEEEEQPYVEAWQEQRASRQDRITTFETLKPGQRFTLPGGTVIQTKIDEVGSQYVGYQPWEEVVPFQPEEELCLTANSTALQPAATISK